MVKKFVVNRPAKLASWILVTIFGLVVFHAPLSVFFGQYAPPLLVKSWKEILLLITTPLVVYALWRSGKLGYFSRDMLLRLIGLYALLHVVLLFVFETGLNQKLAGLAIDLRYLLFFGLVFCLTSLQPSLKHMFLKVGVWAAGLSVSFAALQALLLPHDILKYLGYSKATIAPYLTVDKNSDFIRINGTLRGPNPLGAYVMTILTLTTSFMIQSRVVLTKYKLSFAVGTAALLVSLWASYSRSALLGTGISLSIVFFVSFGHRLHLKHWLAVGTLVLLLVVVTFVTRDSYFIQNVVNHNNPSENQSFNSNQGHTVSLESGLSKVSQQPLGAGIGSAGSASLFGREPLIIENQYLFVAHETGWLGLGLFVTILVVVLGRLYQNRHDWLSLGVFASGIALVVIGLVQPVFVDDTVSMVWWGLAAIALAMPVIKKAKRV